MSDQELESMERKLRRRQAIGSAGLGALAVGGACTVTALDWATFIGVIVGAIWLLKQLWGAL